MYTLHALNSLKPSSPYVYIFFYVLRRFVKPIESTMARVNINSGSTFEAEIGYSRAVVVDDWVMVSGTTGLVGNMQPQGIFGFPSLLS